MDASEEAAESSENTRGTLEEPGTTVVSSPGSSIQAPSAASASAPPPPAPYPNTFARRRETRLPERLQIAEPPPKRTKVKHTHPAQTADPARGGDFQNSDRIRVINLRTDLSMNGSIGTVQGWDAAQSRWLVELDGEESLHFRLRPQCMELLDEEEDHFQANDPSGVIDQTRQQARARQSRSEIRNSILPGARGNTAPRPPPHKVAPLPRGQRERTAASASSPPEVLETLSETTSRDLTFNVLDHVICSEPSCQVYDPDRKQWRSVQLYESLKDARIVVWYGGDMYEGLPPMKPYRLANVPKNSSGYQCFTGAAPGRLLDGDGEHIPTRAKDEGLGDLKGSWS
eukprot:TRINITY_DN5492_c0_g3_i1.p1 TRINITY_DN5492_c0_g3~~TRINITY_DN5492_c0_g3_i1.p1  ORF type:complete len:343 (-),score=58.98 TRINITY_DN5492_c0_g3_i1:97-1125(-)